MKITDFCDLDQIQKTTPFSQTGSRIGRFLVWFAGTIVDPKRPCRASGARWVPPPPPSLL